MSSADEIELMSFEDSYDKLEEVIQSLEEGKLGLDESLALYEKGIRLAQHCGKKLDDAQIKVTQLLAAVADEMEKEPEEDL